MTLEQMRKDLGYTQVQLAEKLGISQAHVSDIESGKKKISPDIQQKLCSIGFTPPFLPNPSKNNEATCSLPFYEASASAGGGIINFDEIPGHEMLHISPKALGADLADLRGAFVMRAKGNSMNPVIGNGDLIFVRPLPDLPRYLEGIFLINYDGELYVKSIQLDQKKLIMKSINKDFDDIIIPNLEDSDIFFQVVGKVFLSIKYL